MKKEYKWSGIVAVIVLSVFLIFTGIKGVLNKEKNLDEQSEKEEIVQTSVSEETSEAEEVIDSLSEEEKNIDTFHLDDDVVIEGDITFENVKSPFIYEIHSEIQVLLNAEAFDNTLRTFVTENNVLDSLNYNVPNGSIPVKSFPYITRFLDGGDYYSFDFQIDTENRPLLNVTFSPDSSTYVFTKLE